MPVSVWVAGGVLAAVVARALFRARAIGSLLAFVVGDLLRIRRTHVEFAMVRAGVAAPARTARAMYASLGRGLLELVQATWFGSSRVLGRVRVPSAVIGELRANGGAVIATAHTGNWDLVACAIARQAPLTVVTKRFSFGFLDRVWQRARAKRGVRLVEVGDTVRGARRAFRDAGLVAMLVDQAPERSRGVARTTFLGAPVWVDLSPALVAARFRVPVVAAFPLRFSDGTLGVEIAGIYPAPPRPTRQWAVRTMTEVTARLDAFVGQHPEQWLWMHRRWKDLPAETARAGSAPPSIRAGDDAAPLRVFRGVTKSPEGETRGRHRRSLGLKVPGAS